MPVVNSSGYRARGIFRNAHINTIYPALFRQVPGVVYQRERLPTPDGDFLDLDWSARGSRRLVIVLHGLEGSADRPYVRGVIRFFNQRGWDGLGLNFRGCGGDPNLLARSYHIGETSDLVHVLEHVLATDRYDQVALVGFSLGGNVILKFLGEGNTRHFPQLKRAVVFSVPCEVSSANREIQRWENYFYRRRFMRSLNAKVLEKARRFPEKVPVELPMPRNFLEFDDRYTAPLHGFRDAGHYWEACSSLPLLEQISIPFLLVNALDDTFLSRKCYPDELAARMPNFFLEMPRWGGHVGFVSRAPGGAYWSEQRAFAFISAEEG